jgi:hypothetical protein
MIGMSDYLFFAIWLAVAMALSFALVYAWNGFEKWTNRRLRPPK